MLQWIEAEVQAFKGLVGISQSDKFEIDMSVRREVRWSETKVIGDSNCNDKGKI